MILKWDRFGLARGVLSLAKVLLNFRAKDSLSCCSAYARMKKVTSRKRQMTEFIRRLLTKWRTKAISQAATIGF